MAQTGSSTVSCSERFSLVGLGQEERALDAKERDEVTQSSQRSWCVGVPYG
jgi:hypothetical protein